METPHRPATILVVEDEPLIALDIEESLVELGLAVRLARSLAEARDALAIEPAPDLVLLDVVLPDGRSFDLAREILAKDVPLVFLTGYDQGIPEDFGAVTVIDKPFSTEALLAAVGWLAGGRQEH
ncbi:MAG TPA: response regulator [Bauldia sp.]|nr:response regulator [Bauldia sp.]